MRRFAIAVIIVLGGLSATHQANAIVCANGVYRAGCVGPNSAAVVRKPSVYHAPVVRCGSGPYRAGCVRPDGAAVVRRPY